MKKAIAVVTLALLALLVQSCGSAEKCPAYSSVNIQQADV